MKEFFVNYPEETKVVVKEVLNNLQDKHVIFLIGDLGSGKSLFVKRIAEVLKIKEVVNSPTFVIMKIYDVANNKFKRLVHIDLYRLDKVGKDQLLELGIQEYLYDPESLVAIEWADKIKSGNFNEYQIHFYIDDKEQRKIVIE